MRYAAERARLLLGCYRKGDANDPDIYVAAITATLGRYPQDVIRSVTHPASGLPTKCGFLPTVKEVFDACEAAMEPRRKALAEERRRKREQAERDSAPQLTDEQRAKMRERLKELSAILSAPAPAANEDSGQ